MDLASLPLPVDYYYEQGLRRLARVPKEIAATPSARPLTLQYLARKAAADETAAARESRTEAQQKRLEESGRQADVSLQFARGQADRQADLNRTARRISLGSLAAEGLNSIVRARETKKLTEMQARQSRMIRELSEARMQALGRVTPFLDRMREMYETALPSGPE